MNQNFLKWSDREKMLFSIYMANNNSLDLSSPPWVDETFSRAARLDEALAIAQ